MLTHIKQPGESSPPFEPSQHIGEAAAMVQRERVLEYKCGSGMSEERGCKDRNGPSTSRSVQID